MTMLISVLAATLLAQQPPARSAYSYDAKNKTVEITNVTYELAGKLVLRNTVHTKELLEEPGIEASTTVEAWPVGVVDFAKKPAYAITVQGTDPQVVENEILTVSRRLDETDWWTVYRLANGARLFDTYTPLAKTSISRETLTLRYAGFDVPPDGASELRRAPNLVGIVRYASAGKLIRSAAITADDAKRAQLLRSYADCSRELTFAPQSIRVAISQNAPSPSNPVTITIPIAKDELDLANVQVPKGLRVSAWN